ncbi:hypothetical protein [Streptomyces sp. AP-93]|uniref:hypothetical protein n=1 Tax=Streptomyces sp. AP-93 TaxID=2929048 RepID=UPI001FAEA475|nr:hypothetical protein [Streptomyces sp. AP-93]MCJ0868336.1 hypothetical protein [Streptomyces sp. AP-93]
MNKRKNQIAVIAVSALSISLMTGCSGSSGASGKAKPVDSVSPSVSGQGSSTPVADAAQIRSLPIEQYLPTPAEFARMSQASARIQQQCMRDFGFSGFTLPEPGLADPRETLSELRYGTVNAAEAARSGYKPESVNKKGTAAGSAEPELSDDQWLVMTGTTKAVGDSASAMAAPQNFGAKAIPEGGCIGQAIRTLTDGSDNLYADLAQDINGQSFRQSQQDPRVTSVFAKWSECMKGKGFDYKDPMQANDDPMFSGSAITPEEIATASADVACKADTNLVGIWHTADAEIQQKLIDQHASKMAPIRTAKQAALRNTAKSLG